MTNLALADLLVLLVEPSPTQTRIVTQMLESLGVYQILPVSDGRSALEQLAREKPDLVISSLYLPDMSGTDLVHAIRADANIRHTAFMLISTETRFRYLDPIRQAGAIAILPKPFTQQALRLALQHTMDFIELDRVELAPSDLDDLRVLIVDDSALARRHIRHIQEGLGLSHFTEAKDGREALGLLNAEFFDLVVTDYNMPNMDGRELVEHIRQDSEQASVPILMVTSEQSESRLAAVQQAGVSAICDKPFEVGSIRRILEGLLSHRG